MKHLLTQIIGQGLQLRIQQEETCLKGAVRLDRAEIVLCLVTQRVEKFLMF